MVLKREFCVTGLCSICNGPVPGILRGVLSSSCEEVVDNSNTCYQTNRQIAFLNYKKIVLMDTYVPPSLPPYLPTYLSVTSCLPKYTVRQGEDRAKTFKETNHSGTTWSILPIAKIYLPLLSIIFCCSSIQFPDFIFEDLPDISR